MPRDLGDIHGARRCIIGGRLLLVGSEVLSWVIRRCMVALWGCFGGVEIWSLGRTGRWLWCEDCVVLWLGTWREGHVGFVACFEC